MKFKFLNYFGWLLNEPFWSLQYQLIFFRLASSFINFFKRLESVLDFTYCGCFYFFPIFFHSGSERNVSRLTLDGVDVMGERLAEEVSICLCRRFVLWICMSCESDLTLTFPDSLTIDYIYLIVVVRLD